LYSPKISSVLGQLDGTLVFFLEEISFYFKQLHMLNRHVPISQELERVLCAEKLSQLCHVTTSLSESHLANLYANC